MVKTLSAVWLVAAALAAVVPISGGIEDLARSGQWKRLLMVADRRAEQLPLQPQEAFLAAHAAGVLGDQEAMVRHLDRATEGGPLGGLARLELAQAVVADDPERAVDLVLPFLRRAPTRTIRSEAVAVAVSGIDGGLESTTRASLDRSQRSLPTSLRRKIELGLARDDDNHRKKRLERLLRASTRDQVALDAARLLQSDPDLTVDDRYLVAKSLYRHALYREAEDLFHSLDGVSSRKISSWELAFLEGRCAFRQGRWDDAAERYSDALARRNSSEGRAELLVHLARVHELNGRLDLAVEAARRAVVARTTDDRRLFLARLRLRLDQPDKARAGLAKLRGRTARSRGEVMFALYEIKKGLYGEARNRLQKIGRQPWRGPAAVIAAGLALDTGDAELALRGLEAAARDLDEFWAGRARNLVKGFPPQLVDAWRSEISEKMTAADDRTRRRLLATWSTLEIDPGVVAELQAEVSRVVGFQNPVNDPTFPPGLASDLWKVGLPGEAVRWDPTGMPRGDAKDAVWTATVFADHQQPWKAIQTADGAWRMAGSDIPARVYPMALQRSLHPLPDPDLVWHRAVDHAIPWAVLAGVAREESRWRPTVVSVVGARGLMQMMPATAISVAASGGRPEPTLDELFDPAVSLALGAAEISRLVGVFDGQLAPAVAAYNAGEAQAHLWLDQCGTPCRSEWYVGNISFSATNNYTRDVIASSETYVDLYGATPGGLTNRSVRRLNLPEVLTYGR